MSLCVQSRFADSLIWCLKFLLRGVDWRVYGAAFTHCEELGVYRVLAYG